MKLNEQFVETVMYNLVRNSCPGGMSELDEMELSNLFNCQDEPDEQKCKECWRLAAEQWAKENKATIR